MALSKRLQTALEYVKGFTQLHDVGTDHGYLPIEAVKKGYVQKCIASDNKPKPYENALTNVSSQGLSTQIEVVLAEGLQYFSPDTDCVSILGMGGRIIRQILEEASLQSVKRLILGPNSDAYTVRDFLELNEYEIEDERFILDQGKYYQIIIAKKGTMDLTEIEKEFGPINIGRKEAAYVAFLTRMIQILEQAILKTTNLEERSGLQARLLELKEIII